MGQEKIRDIFLKSSKLKIECAEMLSDIIAKTAKTMILALKNSHRIYWMGNGGSAADAQHMAAELINRFYKKRRALPSASFHENSSNITSIANDYSYDEVFVRQVEAFVQRGDVVIGLSTSGRSKNVVEALKYARALGAVTVALTGADASMLKEHVDYCLSVPSNDTPRIQECHTTIGHILCELTENAFVSSK